MLKGSIFITSNMDIVCNEDCVNYLTRIISLDEDNVLPESPAVIGGTCLLPPPAAKIAEADGNEALYDEIYAAHLNAPYQREYMAALLSFLYIGGKLVMFIPSVGEDITFDKLLFHIWMSYGIHIGSLDHSDPNSQMCYYNMNFIPQWLEMIYGYTGQISPYDFLIQYPYNLELSPNIINRLLADLKPYGVSIDEKVNVIKSLRKQLQINRNVRLPVEGVM